jgi:hypothetical protein
MMEILQRDEAVPASYPAIPSGLSLEAMMLNASALWARIEAYTAHRFTPREVVWTVAGPGAFTPDLKPATITATEVWDGASWIAASLSAYPLDGLLLNGEGPYRITADVGGGDVPAPVSEAYRRLAEYLAEDGSPAGASSYSYKLGDVEETTQRSPAHVARALQNSGAADLLRRYRRA